MAANDSESSSLDFDIITKIIEKTTSAKGEAERCNLYIELFSYIIKYPNFVRENPEFGHLFRQRSKEIEPTINDLVASGTITFEQGYELVQLSLTFLDQTNFLSEFDFEEIPDLEGVTTRNNTNTNQITPESSFSDSNYQGAVIDSDGSDNEDSDDEKDSDIESYVNNALPHPEIKKDFDHQNLEHDSSH
jgi:hypothetical protein